MFDGEKDDSLIFKALAGMGLKTEDINYLLEAGLIELGGSQDPVVAPGKPVESLTDFSKASADSSAPTLTEQERYQRAYPVATKLTSGLGLSLRGFRLNLAVESAGSYQDLVVLAPKIREAVGDEKFAVLANALRLS